MSVRDVVIGFLHMQEGLLLKNNDISKEVQKKRLHDIHDAIKELGGGDNGEQAV